MKIFAQISVFSIVTALLLTAASAAVAQAEEEGPPGNIAEMWTVHVKPEAQAAFEEAIKAHMPVRKQHNDPFHWETYTNNTGDNLTTYYFRSCCFAWADRDAYDTWEADNPAVSTHWSETVHPHVASYEHSFSEVDFENSHWPEEAPDPKFVGVTTWKTAPGAFQDFSAAKEELSQIAINNGWASEEHQWGWTSSVNGHPSVSLVIPFTDYADMVEPDPTFFEFLTEQVGAEEAAAIFERLSAATRGSHYQIYTHRPDLSTPE